MVKILKSFFNPLDYYGHIPQQELEFTGCSKTCPEPRRRKVRFGKVLWVTGKERCVNREW